MVQWVKMPPVKVEYSVLGGGANGEYEEMKNIRPSLIDDCVTANTERLTPGDIVCLHNSVRIYSTQEQTFASRCLRDVTK